MLKTLSKLNTCVYYWNSVENTPNNYGKRFPPLLRVFPVTPTVVNYSVGNGFYDAFPGNSSTQNELKSKKNLLFHRVKTIIHKFRKLLQFWNSSIKSPNPHRNAGSLIG